MFEAVSGPEGAPDAGGGEAAPRPGRPNGKPPKPDRPPRPPERRPPPGRRKGGPAAETPPGVADEIKAARARAMARANFYNRQSKPWHLAMTWVNLGEHKKAVQIFDMMLRKRMYNVFKSPVRDAARIAPDPLGSYGSDKYMERLGTVQFAYAWSLMNLGKHKAARQILAEAAPKLARYDYPPYYLRHKRQIVHMTQEVFDETKARLEELEASLAETPDGDKQLQVAILCQPEPGKEGSESRWRLDIPLKRLEALLTMIEKYPEHRHVMSGDVHWNLCQAWRAFEMHEKCIAVLNEMMERPFKNYNVSGGNALWAKAESLARLGVLREEMGVRDALGAYRASLETFRAFKTNFPKSSKCRIGESGYSAVQGRIATLEAAVARFSR
ncbi:MAG: hypothetical protein ACYS9X_19570, partial [Planctomycetota bacterium]|jgi:tetratricopeptide (TPR) repeat protein